MTKVRHGDRRCHSAKERCCSGVFRLSLLRMLLEKDHA